jgi:hypothetical protein
MVATACRAKLNEVPLSLSLPLKDEILRFGANSAVACMAAIVFPAMTMPPEDVDAMLYG